MNKLMFDELPRVMYQEKISSLLPFYSMHKIKSNTNTSKIYLLNICTTYVPTYYSRFRSYVFAVKYRHAFLMDKRNMKGKYVFYYEGILLQHITITHRIHI